LIAQFREDLNPSLTYRSIYELPKIELDDSSEDSPR